MTHRRRTIPRQPIDRPPSPHPDELKWVSEVIGVQHNAEAIAGIIERADDPKRMLWLPDTPDMLPPLQYLVEQVLAEEQPFLIHGGVKTLKSSLLAHLIVAVASRAPLFGHFRPMRSRCGPVLAWQVEGGPHYVLDCIDRVCASYGIRRRDLEVEAQTVAAPLDSPSFLYALAARCEAIRPVMVAVEPLYLISPGSWNGSKVTEFNVGAFTSICQKYGAVPLIGHHDKQSAGSNGLIQASGAGPSEWMGQWWHLERLGGDWKGNGADHLLKLSYGARGGGGSQIGLRVDDRTLEAKVHDLAELEEEAGGSSGHGPKSSAFDLAIRVLSFAMDKDEVVPVGELSDLLSGQIDAHCRENQSSGYLKRSVIPALIKSEHLTTYKKSGNVHTVTGGKKFPQ